MGFVMLINLSCYVDVEVRSHALPIDATGVEQGVNKRERREERNDRESRQNNGEDDKEHGVRLDHRHATSIVV